MEEWESEIRIRLFPGEDILTNICDLEYMFAFVPFQPDYDHVATGDMRLILTTHRLIIRFWNGKVVKSLHTS